MNRLIWLQSDALQDQAIGLLQLDAATDPLEAEPEDLANHSALLNLRHAGAKK